MSEECFRVSWSGPRVFIREVDVEVDVCEDYRENFRFVRYHPVRLKALFGASEIEVEDVHGRLIGVVREELFHELESVMGRFRWQNLRVSGLTSRQLGRQSVMVTVRFTICCVTAEEEAWVLENLGCWGGVEGDAETSRA